MYLPFSISPRAHIKLNSLFPFFSLSASTSQFRSIEINSLDPWVRLRRNPNCYIVKRVTPISSCHHSPRERISACSGRKSCCSSLMIENHACVTHVHFVLNYMLTHVTRRYIKNYLPTILTILGLPSARHFWIVAKDMSPQQYRLLIFFSFFLRHWSTYQR